MTFPCSKSPVTNFLLSNFLCFLRGSQQKEKNRKKKLGGIYFLKDPLEGDIYINIIFPLMSFKLRQICLRIFAKLNLIAYFDFLSHFRKI